MQFYDRYKRSINRKNMKNKSTHVQRRERERERILFATELQAYQKGYKPI